MLEVLPTEALQGLRNKSIVLPATGIGNLGQMAVDLLIATLQLPRLAVLQEEHVLPCVGNQAYATDSGVVSCELELYGRGQDSFAVLQQRAPAATGRQEEYAASLASFLRTAQVTEIVVLGSLDMAMRQDGQLQGPQVSFVTTSAETREIMQHLDLRVIEVGSIHADKGWAHSLPPWPLWRQCQDQGIPTSLLLAFSAEGASLPDAMQLAQHALALLGKRLNASLSYYCQIAEPHWIIPPSWGATIV